MFVKKWPLKYQKVNKTYLPTYLWDSNDSRDSSDRFDSRDSSDRIDSSYKTTLWLTICDLNFVTQTGWLNFFTKILWLDFCDLNFMTKILWLKFCY